ncbi:MAG: BamA/OMP85 family outer membrane protein [Candidatus Tyrphobacter sp.]
MHGDFRRVHRTPFRWVGAALAVAVAIVLLAPSMARTAPVPKIVAVDVEGNVHVPTATIMAVVEAHPGQPFSATVVQGDLQRINALGYFAAIAPPLIRQRPGGIAITYRVVENPVITKIVFAGNLHVPSDTLLALMDLAVGQVFNTNTFRSDVLKINNYYERIGYGGQVPTHVKNIDLDPATGALTLQIQEGLTIRRVIIGGDPLLPPTLTLPVLSVKPGVEYSDGLRDHDVQALKHLYEDKYHLELGNFEGGIDPSSINLQTGTADVKYDIYVMRVAVVQITGNTRTKDQVIRRQLRVVPGMVVNTDAIKADYERLNQTQYFSKVEPDIRPGPDPRKPQNVTLVWHVTEQRTASASVGFGYSGGLTGQGLYGTLGLSDNNLHGTGNGVSIQFEGGARTHLAQIQGSIPYLGSTPRSQRYSLTGSIFSSGTTYYYPVYQITGANTIKPVPSVGGTPVPVPVTLYSSTNSAQVTNAYATSVSNSNGFTAQLGRRLSDYTQLLGGVTTEIIKYNTTVPSPYYFESFQPNIFAGPTPNPLNSSLTTNNGSFGIAASSIANVNTGLPYRLDMLTLGGRIVTTDDPYNPRRGTNFSLNETFSAPSIGSSFTFTQTTLDVSRFFPILQRATIGVHFLGDTSTGVIPPSSLFVFSDQQMRGYNQVFYGTDALLGQVELREPLMASGQLSIAVFGDELDYRIRGAQPILNPYTNRITGYPSQWTYFGDVGVGLRFDVPQLGLHTVRVDFARGYNGFHTSFGIGQSF